MSDLDIRKLVSIWIQTPLTKDSPAFIRLDWNNDRHHAIPIKERGPDGLLRAIDELRRNVIDDINSGEL